jgi:hypothetical protein
VTIEYDISNNEYHNERPGYSSTFIKTAWHKSIYHAKNGSSSIAMAVADLGTSVHAMTLEPEKDLVRCGPETRRGNAWKEAYAAAEADGATLLPEKEYYQAEDMAEALLKHAEAGEILKAKDKICEASIFVTHPNGLKLKVRPDIYVPSMSILADVKTAQSSEPRAFARQAWSLGYPIQGAFYKMLAELAGWKVDSFAFLTVEKDKPYTAHVHYLSNEAIAWGTGVVNHVLDQIKSREQSKDWSPDWGPHSFIELPAWLSNNDQEEKIDV